MSAAAAVQESGYAYVSAREASVNLLDGRGKTQVDETALLELERKQSTACQAIKQQSRVFATQLAQELRALPQSDVEPASVAALAHIAVDAFAKHRMLSLVSDGAFSRWTLAAARRFEEHELDKAAAEAEAAEGKTPAGPRLAAPTDERLDKLENQVVHTMRHVAGIAVVCRDVLQSARAAAIASRQEQAANPVDNLRARLGMNAGENLEVLPSVPFEGGGVGSKGPQGSSIHAPPNPPEPGGAK